MKKLLLVLFALFILLSSVAVFAEDVIRPSEIIEKKTENVLKNILPVDIVKDAGKQVPTGNLKYEILPSMIRITLGIVGSISFLGFVYSGIMLIVSQGNEEEITKFKNMLVWAVVGLIFVTTAYALVRGILQLSFES